MHSRRFPLSNMTYCYASGGRCEASSQSCLLRAAVPSDCTASTFSTQTGNEYGETTVGTAAAGTTADSTAGDNTHQFIHSLFDITVTNQKLIKRPNYNEHLKRIIGHSTVPDQVC